MFRSGAANTSRNAWRLWWPATVPTAAGSIRDESVTERKTGYEKPRMLFLHLLHLPTRWKGGALTAAPVNSKQWLQLGLWRRRTNGQRWPPDTRPSAGRKCQLCAELERISTCNTTRLVVGCPPRLRSPPLCPRRMPTLLYSCFSGFVSCDHCAAEGKRWQMVRRAPNPNGRRKTMGA